MIDTWLQNPWVGAIIIIVTFFFIIFSIRDIYNSIYNRKWFILKWNIFKWKVNGPPDIIMLERLWKLEEIGFKREDLPDNYNHYYLINNQLYKVDCLPGYLINKKFSWRPRTFLKKAEIVEEVPTWQIRKFTKRNRDIYVIYFAPAATAADAYNNCHHASAIGEEYHSFDRRMERRQGQYDYIMNAYIWVDKNRAERLLNFLESRYIMNQLVINQ